MSCICVALSLFVVFNQRLSAKSIDLIPGRMASMGYALPGTVLAIAVLLPLSLLDNAVNQL